MAGFQVIKVVDQKNKWSCVPFDMEKKVKEGTLDHDREDVA